jgi:hypothetical protein
MAAWDTIAEQAQTMVPGAKKAEPSGWFSRTAFGKMSKVQKAAFVAVVAGSVYLLWRTR